jgi:surface protein
MNAFRFLGLWAVLLYTFLCTAAATPALANCPAIAVTNPTGTVYLVGTGGTISYDAMFTQIGGAEPVTFSLYSGTLPPQFTLSADGRLLSQGYLGEGAITFRVQVMDANGCIGIGPEITLTNAPLDDPDLGAMIGLRDDCGWGTAFAWPTNSNPCPNTTVDINWNGVTCQSINGQYRTTIIIAGCGVNKLNGTASPAPYLSALTALRSLDIRSCYTAQPRAASEFSFLDTFSQLQRLRIDNNTGLSGTMADIFPNGLEATRFPEMNTGGGAFYIGNTQISGPLPAGLFTFSAGDFRFHRAQFSGTLPSTGSSLPNELWLNGNKLEGTVPDVLRNAPLNKIIYLRYNMLDVENTPTGNIDQIDPLWRSTQTVPPTNVQVTPAGLNTAALSWTPIAYQAHGGYYEVLSATSPGGPYTSRGVTTDKTATGLTVTGLPGGTNYFVVRTFTPAHVSTPASQLTDNPNDLTSKYSGEISASIACVSPEGNIRLDRSAIFAGGTVQLSFTATVGTGPFSVTVNGVTYSNVSSGMPFATFVEGANFTNNATFTLTDISDAANCSATGLSQAVSVAVVQAGQAFVTTWKTDNSGISGSSQITIPGTGTNYTIIWEAVGDAGVNGFALGNNQTTVSFPAPGTYRVSIYSGGGTFHRIRFNNGGDRLKLLRIDQWGDIAWSNLEDAFKGCSNMTYHATDIPDFSVLTDISSMFSRCTAFNGAIGGWDMSTVTDMNRLFEECSSFNQPIGGWDVSQATNMASMFNGASLFNQPIGDWDVSQVTSMGSMFGGATSFNQPIGGWNTESLVDISRMFTDAISFNQPIGGWDVSLVTGMFNTFRGAGSFNQNLGDWNLQNIGSMFGMLDNCGMSCSNYSATLVGWAANSGIGTPDLAGFGAAGLQYGTNAVAARNILLGKGWLINGDAPSGTECLLCPAVGLLTWTGAADTNWHNPSNWDAGCVPTADNDVTTPSATNQPTISAAGAVAHSVYVQSGATLTIAAAGDLTIHGFRFISALSFGFLNQGTVHNAGKLTIAAVSGVNQYGIWNETAFNNNTGGEIQIDRSSDVGLFNDFGIFTNVAKITIGANNSVVLNGIRNRATFNNNTGGDIQIDGSSTAGINNDFGAFTNAAKITIGANAGVGESGIRNIATFQNNTGGEIQIDRSSIAGIQALGGNFTNAAQITIGANASVGDYGIYNLNTFQNNSGGDIQIDNSSTVGLYNQLGAFSNAAKITIGANASVGGYGLWNQSSFQNTSCGELSTFAPVNNSATITNTGLIRSNTTNAHTNAALTNNGIIEYPQGNPIPNVTNNEIIIAPTTANECDVISPVFSLGSPVDFTIEGIFTDEAATMSAGTYVTATNTFTPTSILAEDTRTFYVKITDGNGGCTRIVAWQLTTQNCCDAPQAICMPATAVLIGNSANIAVADVDNGSTTDCGLQSITVSPNTFNCSHVGTPQTVTLTVTDVKGSSSTCTTTVTVQDITPPSITCPATQTLVLDANCTATLPNYTGLAAVSDSCGVQSVTQSPAAGTLVSGAGNMVVRLYATDINNNIDSCSFTVTKVDNTPPSITCPATQTLVLDANCRATLPNYTGLAAVSDSCGVQSVTQSPAAGTLVSGAGNMVVRLFATDVNNNIDSCSFTVIKVDNTPPTIQCFNQTVTFNGETAIPLNAGSLVDTTDNCGVATIALSPTGISCEQVGQTVPVTVTVTDINGNPATCTSNITVTGLPCGWSQQPDGVNCANGNNIAYNPANGVWTATSTNCFYASPFTSDATAFAQRTLCGDGSVTAQVTDISGTALGWAGVVMRESNAAGAKKAQLMTNLSNFSRREFRTTTNGAAMPQQFPSQNRYWLRLVRAGSQFSMYVSANGLAWYFVGAQNIPMNACIQVGLVATNYQQNSTVTATFANVGFTGSNVPPLAGASTPLSTLEPATNASTPLSTNNEQRSTDFQVYPNPTSGELNVDLAQYVGRAVRLEVYSLTGQLLRFVEIDEVQTTVERLDLSGFASGLYLVKVKSDGLPDATRRIVVTR